MKPGTARAAMAAAKAPAPSNFGGRYGRPDEEMLTIWRVAVEETRAIIDSGW